MGKPRLVLFHSASGFYWKYALDRDFVIFGEEDIIYIQMFVLNSYDVMTIFSPTRLTSYKA